MASFIDCVVWKPRFGLYYVFYAYTPFSPVWLITSRSSITTDRLLKSVMPLLHFVSGMLNVAFWPTTNTGLGYVQATESHREKTLP